MLSPSGSDSSAKREKGVQKYFKTQKYQNKEISKTEQKKDEKEEKMKMWIKIKIVWSQQEGKLIFIGPSKLIKSNPGIV